MTTSTPMLQQYLQLKRQHPGTLLFFRLGDFYELFYDDAVTGARELQITLTARNKERGAPIPMCGVPHHAAASHIARLVRKGYRVAICEQTEDPSKTKKLVRREVVRVVTPGTAIDPQLIEAHESVYLAAVCGVGDTMAAAFLDLSTGEFRATEVSGTTAWRRVCADIESYAPRELLFPRSLTPLIRDACAATETPPQQPASHPMSQEVEKSAQQPPPDDPTEPATATFGGGGNLMALTPLDDWLWQPAECAALLQQQFGVRDLSAYGLADKSEAICAAGACLRYAHETQRVTASHVTEINYSEAQDYLVLDSVTVRNLELVARENAAAALSTGTTARTIFGVINQTVTSMGARLLRSWLLRPSLRQGEIEARLSAVEDLYKSQLKRDGIQLLLREVSDLERLIGRINLNTVSPRELLALRRSLDQVPAIRQALSDVSSSLLLILSENAEDLPDVRAVIAAALSESPPASVHEGGAIRDGHNSELDELRTISRDAKQTIAALEAQERTRSGINSLRVRFNSVFGYFIEVPKASAKRVPVDYERRQTLANAERYTTPELREWERRVLGAEERIQELETSIFAELRAAVAHETKRLQGTARALAMLDVVAALAETAVRRRYVRPVLHDGDLLEISEGRHPVIESFGDKPFIANDLHMNNSTERLLIITGPNMGGKSTVLRQTALIAILAQMGSFVPATQARLPIFDRIWTRVGASDDLASGRSTFMVEMAETAAILHSATSRSLVILDEIGRGTATFDGLSIAWAVAEYLHDSPHHAAKTLFATHYHELTELAARLPGARNYHITVAEQADEVVFLYRLEPGPASKSYGIEVARLAGLPASVLVRARDVLARLERYELDVFAEEVKRSAVASGAAPHQPAAVPRSTDEAAAATYTSQPLQQAAKRLGRRALAAQTTLFDTVNQSLLDELRTVNVETLSAEEARTLLLNVRQRIV